MTPTRVVFSLLCLSGLLGCTAPVEEQIDGGFIAPDAGLQCENRGLVECELPQTDGGPRAECADLDRDEAHCGECGRECANPAAAPECRDGVCACGDTAAACDGTPTSTCCFSGAWGCMDLTTDDRNCGACQEDCTIDDSISTRCLESECVCGELTDPCTGQLTSTCCMDDPKTGAGARCSNLLQSETDCGECNRACLPPEGDRCHNGQCVCGPGTAKVVAVPCPEGQECCGAKTEAATCVPLGSCGD